MRASALIVGMENHALKTGDADLAFDIANSELVSETSIHAQEMRILAERSPDSFTVRLRELKNARQTLAEKKFATGRLKKSEKGKIFNKELKKVRDELKAEVKKTRPKKEDWTSFIDSIKC